MKTTRKPMAPRPKGKPGEQHPGQTAEQSTTHDRKGSQLEVERHMHPNGSIPKAGSARSNKRPKGAGGTRSKKSSK